MINEFVQLLIEEIPSFAFGYHKGTEFATEDILRVLITSVALKSAHKTLSAEYSKIIYFH